MRLLQLVFIFIFLIALQGLKADVLQGATQQTGTITSFSLEEHTMIIGQTEYRLADSLIVVSKGNVSTSNGHLQNGKQIDFWVISDPETGTPTIKKIRLLYEAELPS